MVMELCPGDSLDCLLKEDARLYWEERLRTFLATPVAPFQPRMRSPMKDASRPQG